MPPPLLVSHSLPWNRIFVPRLAAAGGRCRRCRWVYRPCSDRLLLRLPRAIDRTALNMAACRDTSSQCSVLTALLTPPFAQQAAEPSQDQVHDVQRYITFLMRVADFHAAPVAAVLVLDGHLAALLRQAADVQQQLLRSPQAVGAAGQDRQQVLLWVSWSIGMSGNMQASVRGCLPANIQLYIPKHACRTAILGTRPSHFTHRFPGCQSLCCVWSH